MQDFWAEIIKDNEGRLTYIRLPFDAGEVFGRDRGTLFVSGRINDVPYRNRLLSRGGGQYIMVLNKELQKAVGFDGAAVTVHITMSLEEAGSGQRKEIPLFAKCDMDVLTAVKTRRSMRRFGAGVIDRELIPTILYAGMCAPSAKDKRPCHFVVIEEKNMLCELAHHGAN